MNYLAKPCSRQPAGDESRGCWMSRWKQAFLGLLKYPWEQATKCAIAKTEPNPTLALYSLEFIVGLSMFARFSRRASTRFGALAQLFDALPTVTPLGRAVRMASVSALAAVVFAPSITCAASDRLDAAQARPAVLASDALKAITAPKGAYRAIDLQWNDATRGREVPARLYWPERGTTDAAKDATKDTAKEISKVPLVVFSHGLGGSRFGYSYLGRHWASLGIASLHVQHEGSDRSVWFGNVFKLVSNLQNAASEQNAIARAKDVSFAISQVLAEKEFAQHIDADSIAVAGHSYGANTAMLIGGATVVRDGKPLALRDERVKALILISAPPFSSDGDMVSILSPIKVPTLHVTGTEDVIRVPGYYSDFRDRLAVYDAQLFPKKMITVFKGATHSIFTDRIDRAGLDLNEKVKRATKEISGIFLRTVLKHETHNLLNDWGLVERDLLERHAGSLASQ
jgi:pimeloyl-ACP methyl ester carboxylesterase